MVFKANEKQTSESKRKRRTKQEQEHSGRQDSTLKKRKRSHPLRGVLVSVSTLTGDSDSGSSEKTSFNGVTGICKDLGAQVSSQVSKRVQVLVCTDSAVKQATQRIRKAFKKGIPIVDVKWLDICKSQGEKVDYTPFLLDDAAKQSIDNRQSKIDGEKAESDIPPDTGWSEPASLGCCCVCHENGSEKDCSWCVDCVK